MEIIKENIKKILKKEAIFYVLFGVLTTAINLILFYIFANIIKWDENLSNFIAITLSICVAYITNKDLVFHSKAKTLKEKINEFVKFFTGRAFTMVLELLGGFILFKLPIPNLISKAIITGVLVILNFVISKFFVFNKSKKLCK